MPSEQRTQVSSKLGAGIGVGGNVAVFKGNNYARPEQAQADTTLSDFLTKLSPTLANFVNTKELAKKEQEAEKVVAEMRTKTVKDFDAIFATPENYNKFVGEFNSLTAQAQKNLGRVLASKYGEETKRAIAQKAILEGWDKLPPKEVQDKLNAANKAAVSDIGKKNPATFDIPDFIGNFSESLESNATMLLTNHLPQYGAHVKKTLTDSIAFQAMDLVKKGKDDTTIAASIVSLAKEQGKVLPGMELNDAIVEGIIATKDVTFMEKFLDGRVQIAIGPEGATLNKTFIAQDKIGKALVAIRKEKNDVANELFSSIQRKRSGAELFIEQDMYNGGGGNYKKYMAWGKANGLTEFADSGTFNAIRMQVSNNLRNGIFAPSLTTMSDSVNRVASLMTLYGSHRASSALDGLNYTQQQKNAILSQASQVAGTVDPRVSQHFKPAAQKALAEYESLGGKFAKDANVFEQEMTSSLINLNVALSSGNVERYENYEYLNPKDKAYLKSYQGKYKHIVNAPDEAIAHMARIAVQGAKNANMMESQTVTGDNAQRTNLVKTNAFGANGYNVKVTTIQQ